MVNSAPLACIVDSDVLIDALRGRRYAHALLDTWKDRGLVGMSAMSVLELAQGVRPADEQRMRQFVQQFSVLPVDHSIADQAGITLRNFRRQGATLGMADTIIGITAIREGVPLLTHNTKDYPLPGLHIITSIRY